MSFDNSIKFYRTMRGWTQKDLAAHIGVSVYTVIAIEHGKHDPKLTLAVKLARAFSMSVEELFFEKGKNPPKRLIEGVE